MPADLVSLLRAIPLFRQLGLAELYLLAGIGVEEQIPAGTTLGVEGERLADLWVILEGTIATTSPATEAAESFLEGPAIWGSSALVEPYTGYAAAVAATDCRVLRIPIVDIRELATRNPRLGVRLYEEFASSIFARLRRLTEESVARHAAARSASSALSAPSALSTRPAPSVRGPGVTRGAGEAPPDATALMMRAPLFDRLQPDQVRLLYALGVERRLPPGAVLGTGGHVLEWVWVILDGEIEAGTPLTGNTARLRGPETWGIASLVPPHTPSSTAVTVTECRVVQISSADIRGLLEQNPRLGVDFYQALCTNTFRLIRYVTDAEPGTPEAPRA